MPFPVLAPLVAAAGNLSGGLAAQALQKALHKPGPSGGGMPGLSTSVGGGKDGSEGAAVQVDYKPALQYFSKAANAYTQQAQTGLDYYNSYLASSLASQAAGMGEIKQGYENAIATMQPISEQGQAALSQYMRMLGLNAPSPTKDIVAQAQQYATTNSGMASIAQAMQDAETIRDPAAREQAKQNIMSQLDQLYSASNQNFEAAKQQAYAQLGPAPTVMKNPAQAALEQVYATGQAIPGGVDPYADALKAGTSFLASGIIPSEPYGTIAGGGANGEDLVVKGTPRPSQYETYANGIPDYGDKAFDVLSQMFEKGADWRGSTGTGSAGLYGYAQNYLKDVYAQQKQYKAQQAALADYNAKADALAQQYASNADASQIGSIGNAYRATYSDNQNYLGFTGQEVTDQLRATPGYQFQEEQGNLAVQRSAAAKGMLSSGNTLASIAKYTQGLADSTYQEYMNNLYNIATQGTAAAGQIAEYQANEGIAVGNAYNNIASTLMGAGQTTLNAYQQIGQMQYQGFADQGNTYTDIQKFNAAQQNAMKMQSNQIQAQQQQANQQNAIQQGQLGLQQAGFLNNVANQQGYASGASYAYNNGGGGWAFQGPIGGSVGSAGNPMPSYGGMNV